MTRPESTCSPCSALAPWPSPTGWTCCPGPDRARPGIARSRWPSTALSRARVGRRRRTTARSSCSDPECELRSAVFVPLVLGDDVIGSLAAYTDSASPGLVRATEEVAAWVSAQLELAQSSRDRPRLMEAELRALRAQISPHFIYNALAAIACPSCAPTRIGGP